MLFVYICLLQRHWTCLVRRLRAWILCPGVDRSYMNVWSFRGYSGKQRHHGLKQVAMRGKAESYHFPTDSCTFPTEKILGAQNFNFAINSPPNGEFYTRYFGRKFFRQKASDKIKFNGLIAPCPLPRRCWQKHKFYALAVRCCSADFYGARRISTSYLKHEACTQMFCKLKDRPWLHVKLKICRPSVANYAAVRPSIHCIAQR